MFYMTHSHDEIMHTDLDLSLDMIYEVVKRDSSGRSAEFVSLVGY